MTYEMYRYMFIIAGVLALVMLSVSLILFFKFNIPKVVGDITGTTARKAIEDLREQNTKSGDKAHKPSPINFSRGKLTDKISASGKLTKNPTNPLVINVGTENIGLEAYSQNTTILDTDSPSAFYTTVLDDQIPEMAHSNIVIEFDITYVNTNEVI